MDNSLSSKHTIHYFRNKLHEFRIIIKHNSHDSISNSDTILSSSSHENKSISNIKDKTLIPYNDLKTSNTVPKNSYFDDSIFISDFGTSFHIYIIDTNSGSYKINPEFHKIC